MITILDPNVTAQHIPSAAPLRSVNAPPPWRPGVRHGSNAAPPTPRAMSPAQLGRGRAYRLTARETSILDAALALRRPVLVQGPVGAGKSSLAYAVAWQLGLGDVLHWGITSRSTLREGLYQYDAIARLNAVALQEKSGGPAPAPPLGDFLRLGPLGTALAPLKGKHYFPRVLLIDEIDKCDADLPSDLLHVFEEGQFEIAEVARLPDDGNEKEIALRTAESRPDAIPALIPRTGIVRCDDFPLIIMTSNREREFPPAFLRRCLLLDMQPPDEERLLQIARAHLGDLGKEISSQDIEYFAKRLRENPNQHSTDQLLNALLLRRALGLDDSASAERAMHKLQDAPGD